ncbi:TIGR03936 family radical SAM-associated protein [Halarsenatibacter silvermanii]|nr:TIGR03936 family radical SAM-associated protein [Halarsenatibacter silvermanii]
MIRSRFAKKRRLRYISHLELLDTFRRAVRRAKIPGKYSEGYNPTLNLSLSQPLPVGMPGGGEYLDLELKESVSGEKFVIELNKNLPAGIKMDEARMVGDKNLKSLQALVDRARYIIEPPENKDDEYRIILDKLKNSCELIVTRERRNKDDRQYNIREMIHEIDLTEDNRWSFLVSTGSRGNVRPQEIVQALRKFKPGLPVIPITNFYREGMYVSYEDRIITPLSEEILKER